MSILNMPHELTVQKHNDSSRSYHALELSGLIPGKPVAYNYGLFSVNYGLLWGIVAYYFGLLGVPGTCKVDSETT